jgi:hypothetical protein
MRRVVALLSPQRKACGNRTKWILALSYSPSQIYVLHARNGPQQSPEVDYHFNSQTNEIELLKPYYNTSDEFIIDMEEA